MFDYRNVAQKSGRMRPLRPVEAETRDPRDLLYDQRIACLLKRDYIRSSGSDDLRYQLRAADPAFANVIGEQPHSVGRCQMSISSVVRAAIACGLVEEHEIRLVHHRVTHVLNK